MIVETRVLRFIHCRHVIAYWYMTPGSHHIVVRRRNGTQETLVPIMYVSGVAETQDEMEKVVGTRRGEDIPVMCI